MTKSPFIYMFPYMYLPNYEDIRKDWLMRVALLKNTYEYHFDGLF